MDVHPLDENYAKKRPHSPETSVNNTNTLDKLQQKVDDKTTCKHRRVSITHQDEDGDLLTRLTEILVEIKTTPSTGEISAELLGQLRRLMLRIDELAADKNNIEARQLKDESDKYLELWFEDLVAQCDADGEIDWENVAYEQQQEDGSDDDNDDEDMIALAMALQDEEDAIEKDEQDNGLGESVAVTMESSIVDDTLCDTTGLDDRLSSGGNLPHVTPRSPTTATTTPGTATTITATQVTG